MEAGYLCSNLFLFFFFCATVLVRLFVLMISSDWASLVSLQEVDIWSYGCVLLELLTLQIPYAGFSDSEFAHLLQVCIIEIFF